MSRRASLPGAAELFRPTSLPSTAEDAHVTSASSEDGDGSPSRRGSGREKHDTKITVYVSDEELLALEHARLALRATYGLVADRGRVVREAIAVILANFDEDGENSMLVHRLRRESDR